MEGPNPVSRGTTLMRTSCWWHVTKAASADVCEETDKESSAQRAYRRWRRRGAAT